MARSHVVDSVLAAILLVLTFGASPSASQTGFQNINCGGESYTDPNTKILWDSDPFNPSNNSLIHGKVGKANSSSNVLKTLRYFPDYTRNRKFCYSLGVSNGRIYLLRASFLYGNYDGNNQPPTFVLIINSDVWTNVSTSSSTIPTMHEIIFVSNEDYLNICLAPIINSNHTPFISTLQLRLLESGMYLTSDGSLSKKYGLMLQRRINYGAITNVDIRYPEDSFDRIWEANTTGPTVSTSTSNVGLSYMLDPEQPAAEVMATAIVSDNAQGNLSFTYENLGGFGGWLILMHFQEVDEKARGQSERSIGVEMAGQTNYNIFPDFGGPLHFYFDAQAQFPDPLQFKLFPVAGSPRGPLLNAIELFTWTSQPFPTNGTFQGDVNAIQSLQAYFNITGYAQGDPCLPKGYTWTWIHCDDQPNPRITNIDLASFNLVGVIPPSINQLTSLETVDLHHNNLTGALPSSLSSLPKLVKLDVSYNDICGTLPTFRLSTNFTFVGNSRICNNGSKCDCDSSSSSSSSMLPTVGRKNNSTRKYIIVISFFGALYMMAILLLLVFYKARHNRKTKGNSTSAKTTYQKGVDDFKGLTFMSKMFTYEEIKNATLDFTTILGQGGFGKVYHGLLPTGEAIAVKMLSDASKQGLKQFYNEVVVLSRVRHKNLVSLIGYCVENTYMLVYEYIAKGNLRDLIYGDVESNDKPLPWTRRLHIALDASQGLEYLHMGCDPSIIHRDVKSSNILLSDKMQAKVADFGLSRLKEGDNTISHVSTVNVVGTAGYLDPAYNSTNQLTDKSDVYSFGVVLFELICGRAPIDMLSSPPHIVDWARQTIVQGKVGDILDPMLGKGYKVESMWRAIDVAIGCVESDRAKRPNISQVVELLQNALEVEMDQNIPSNSQDVSGSSSTSDGKLPTLQYLESIQIKLEPR